MDDGHESKLGGKGGSSFVEGCFDFSGADKYDKCQFPQQHASIFEFGDQAIDPLQQSANEQQERERCFDRVEDGAQTMDA